MLSLSLRQAGRQTGCSIRLVTWFPAIREIIWDVVVVFTLASCEVGKPGDPGNRRAFAKLGKWPKHKVFLCFVCFAPIFSMSGASNSMVGQYNRNGGAHVVVWKWKSMTSTGTKCDPAAGRERARVSCGLSHVESEGALHNCLKCTPLRWTPLSSNFKRVGSHGDQEMLLEIELLLGWHWERRVQK